MAEAMENLFLGKLLLMQSIMACLPDESILPFSMQGLRDIEGVDCVEFVPDGAPSRPAAWRFVLASNTYRYGEVLIDPPEMRRFQPYDEHIRNFLFMLILVLDERRQRALLANYQRHLEEQVAERTRELAHRNTQLMAAQAATITAFSALTEARHHETGHHIQRTRNYVRLLAQALQSHPRFRDQLNPETAQLIANSAPLHDIGKVAIPDRILLKPGKLTPAEWEVMKTHCVIGRDTIIASAHELEDGDDAYLEFAADIAYTHHERWDGTGYPRGLAGDAIPLCGRLMAVADVYDALTSKRVYKQAGTHDEALELLLRESGKHFDPDIVNTALAMSEEFHRIAEQYSDHEEVYVIESAFPRVIC